MMVTSWMLRGKPPEPPKPQAPPGMLPKPPGLPPLLKEPPPELAFMLLPPAPHRLPPKAPEQPHAELPVRAAPLATLSKTFLLPPRLYRLWLPKVPPTMAQAAELLPAPEREADWDLVGLIQLWPDTTTAEEPLEPLVPWDSLLVCWLIIFSGHRKMSWVRSL